MAPTNWYSNTLCILSGSQTLFTSWFPAHTTILSVRKVNNQAWSGVSFRALAFTFQMEIPLKCLKSTACFSKIKVETNIHTLLIINIHFQHPTNTAGLLSLIWFHTAHVFHSRDTVFWFTQVHWYTDVKCAILIPLQCILVSLEKIQSKNCMNHLHIIQW